ncbi:hypothetical protein EVAR_66860_1 [Eumeta japonica]|uniref:Uncharacterized protein n=1 Tax=Eumeta variegata TaxID=151549 RepID=A0A4C1ZKT7_EUMVA|nr:hypothetical protein EVAR_66860_1 [Eumeta japonica]
MSRSFIRPESPAGIVTINDMGSELKVRLPPKSNKFAPASSKLELVPVTKLKLPTEQRKESRGQTVRFKIENRTKILIDRTTKIRIRIVTV